ncbi:hypothetical protein LguiB_013813 [Lonicera macranthoides]
MQARVITFRIKSPTIKNIKNSILPFPVKVAKVKSISDKTDMEFPGVFFTDKKSMYGDSTRKHIIQEVKSQGAPVGRNQAKPNSQWNISRSYGGWSVSCSRSVYDSAVDGSKNGKGTSINSNKACNFQNDPLCKEGTTAGIYPNNHAKFNDKQFGYYHTSIPYLVGLKIRVVGPVNQRVTCNLKQAHAEEILNEMGLANGPAAATTSCGRHNSAVATTSCGRHG